MKNLFYVFMLQFVAIYMYGQVSYLQYRVVPTEHEEEFILKETEYWSKVAKAAIDKGQMLNWSLWERVGVTNTNAPNFVFVNGFKDFDSIDQSAIWSEENLKQMGVTPAMVETNSISTVYMDYWMQLEDAAGSNDYTYAVVNYGMPESLSGFITENKKLWKPLHEKNINAGKIGMTSWGLMSTVHPQGKNARFSCLTWDGFKSMAAALNYLRYRENSMTEGPLAEAISQSKMNEIIPGGFEYSILYRLVKRIEAE